LDQAARLVYAIRMMDLGGYRHIPVVDAGGKPQSVISIRDILRYFNEKMSQTG
jgi:CBS domain-containing protein